MRFLEKAAITIGMLAMTPAIWAADAAPKIDSGDTAWMLISMALVLLMTMPGIALFYAGMSRKKNMLSILMQTSYIACALSILWYAVGYSLAFGEGNAFIGDLSFAFFRGIDINSVTGTIPTMLYAVFQMTFIVITGGLIIGSFAGRMKFSAMAIFIVLWGLLVYCPICHWVWSSSGFFAKLGALDYAGGTVVHINAGIAGLVSCLVIGKRLGYGRDVMTPHNLTYAMIGASLLWVGWFGFNAGSALAANGRAVYAMAVTQIATAAAGISWMTCEWIARGKPSLLGIISGMVAGLVAITPASGFVEPFGALIIGLCGGAACFWGATVLKRAMGWDDSLDAFGVHGVGGIVGALLTAFFATSTVTGAETTPMLTQLGIQAASIVGTLAWSGIVSFIILKVIDKVIGLRVSAEDELMGLDLSQHGERIE